MKMGNLGSDLNGSIGGEGATDPAAVESPREGKHGRRRKRPGPGNPGKRGTETEMEERVIVVARLLTRRLHLHQIKQFLLSKYDLGPRSAATYITKAQR